MDFLKNVWPHAFAVKKNDVKDLVIRILLYALVGWALPGIVGLVLGIANFITFGLLTTIIEIICWAIGAYCTVGIVLTLLKYFKVIS